MTSAEHAVEREFFENRQLWIAFASTTNELSILLGAFLLAFGMCYIAERMRQCMPPLGRSRLRRGGSGTSRQTVATGVPVATGTVVIVVDERTSLH